MDDNTSQATGTGQQAAAQPTQTAPQAGQQSEQGKAASDEKVFSQSDLNSIIRDRLSKVNEKLTTLQNELKAERDKNADLTSQVENFTNRELANKQGIPSKFTDYAIFEAKKLTSDGNKTFEDAIKEIAETNAEMFNIQPVSSNEQGSRQQATQPVFQGNSSPQGQKAKTSTVDEEVQAFLDKKFGKRR